MAKDDLKNLPPEERIKKLKELEKQRKQEIEEAQKEIKNSEEEINEKHKQQEKVPIPEVGKEDLEGLSEEGKELLRAHKGIKKKDISDNSENIDINNQRSDSEKKQKLNNDDSLEKVVGSEKNRVSSATLQGEYGGQQGLMAGVGEYKPLSQLDMPSISQEIKNIYQAVEERGYITGFEQKKVGYALLEVEKRLEDIEAGHYKGFTEETAQAASLIQQMGSNLQGLYKSTKRMYN
ncbi:hypothetical protein HYU21_03280 [Candidatus Woesearchaeota archaeon]|nr:hypothetical protein [Candidatus Woesearchaeota archaeon]